MSVNKKWILHINRNNCLIILVYILMYFSRDTYLFGTNSKTMMLDVPIYVMLIYIGVELLYYVQRKRTKQNQGILFFGILFILIYVSLCMYHKEVMQIAIIKFLCIITAMLFTLNYDFDEFAEAFIKVMTFNAVTAIILEVTAYGLRPLASVLPRMVNTAGTQITSILVAGINRIELGTTFIRAYGIFWEPGVFQIYLNIALLFLLFRKQTISVRRVIILAIGVAITFSTTGYIVFGFIIATYFLLTRKENLSRNTKLLFFVFLIVAIFAMLLVDTSFLNEYVFGKLSNSDSGSTIARQASVVINLQIFKDYPLTGIGMRFIQDEYVRRSGLYFIRRSLHNTNTLLYQFAAHGLFFGGIFLYGTYRMTYCLTRKKIVQFALLVAIVLLYVGENLRYSVLPFIIMFYGYGVKFENKIRIRI